MRIKKDKKTIFWSGLIAIILFALSEIISVIEHTYDKGTAGIVLEILMFLVLIRTLIVSCVEKK